MKVFRCSYVVPNTFSSHIHSCVFKEIVQQLIDNSTTFKDKTEFAQEKYIKKKKKKSVQTIFNSYFVNHMENIT